MAQHTLSVLVENSPGVLARVASLFSRRGYNIDSLAVGPTENPAISRMTIVLNLEGHALDQVSGCWCPSSARGSMARGAGSRSAS